VLPCTPAVTPNAVTVAAVAASDACVAVRPVFVSTSPACVVARPVDTPAMDTDRLVSAVSRVDASSSRSSRNDVSPFVLATISACNCTAREVSATLLAKVSLARLAVRVENTLLSPAMRFAVSVFKEPARAATLLFNSCWLLSTCVISGTRLLQQSSQSW
jgi:hypothetical protein